MQGVANTFFQNNAENGCKTQNSGGETFSPVNSMHVLTFCKNRPEI